MVSDEQKRHKYLTTLKVEADRLAHLVENVLAYARLERGKRPGRGQGVEVVTLDDLLRRCTSRLSERALQAGAELVVDMPADSGGAGSAGAGTPGSGGTCARASGVTLRTDCSAVEQVLFNLVDNACKYATSARNRTIRVEGVRDGRRVLIRVRDYGPGISATEARQLFRPFSKSAHEAANSAPGVGLGLALCQRLARNLGGDLVLDRNVSDGACFVLSLPSA
jgi:signal transduction histidine kinase